MTNDETSTLRWSQGTDEGSLLTREWLVTNGLGGYASGSMSGVSTRRFHGWLVAALPAPLGRTLLLNHIDEAVQLPSGDIVQIGGVETPTGVALGAAKTLREFRLERGLPIWTFRVGEHVIEKRLVMPHGQNTTMVTYALREGSGSVELRLRPSIHIRAHEGRVDERETKPYAVHACGGHYEVLPGGDLPTLRLHFPDAHARVVLDGGSAQEFVYEKELSRGYEGRGPLWSPGEFRGCIRQGEPFTITVSSERWETIVALSPAEAWAGEIARRDALLETSGTAMRSALGSELVIAADQFVITPATRVVEAVRAHATGDEANTVIAGYHWFTDWGRDTMISLEGLTLVTGRHAEAGRILRTFARHVRNGLIPNLFPEGESKGLYHTADATLWFFHAVDRYVATTGDRAMLSHLLPVMREIIDYHLRGTDFGIGVDPSDGLLTQGAQGYQLTWMDAKVGDWVVTPRRGKAVEINALFYNALRLLERWLGETSDTAAAHAIGVHAERLRTSFHKRFWYDQGGYLYDVVDGEAGDDAALRPNQIFSLSLPNPVLDPARWKRVVDVVGEELLTPVGLRSLSRQHPDYKPRYDGDLRARDAAYHQGTVWGWLIGPFLDAWRKVYPGRDADALRLLEGFRPHLREACVGSISEVFDAEAPFTPRGCIAQAWSVAEVLRCLVSLAPAATK